MLHSHRPNCTFPLERPAGFVYNPNIRSTLDIVWSCSSIILLSTWSVLHLTVPPDIEAKTTTQAIRKNLYLLQRKLFWMGLMLMFPEYLLAIGAANFFSARENNKELQDLADSDGVPWSPTHTVQADMGGIAIRFSENVSEHASLHGSILHGSIQGPKPASIRTGGLHSTRQSVHRQGDILAQENIDSGDFVSPHIPERVSDDIHEFRDVDRATLGTSDIPLETMKSSSVVLFTQEEPENIPKFLKTFQQAQERYLRKLGVPPWAPLSRHIKLAAQYIRPDGNSAITDSNHIAPFHGNIWIVDSKQLWIARQLGIIHRLPCIRLEEIDDKSKSDGLMRFLSVVQVLWLILQLVVRLILRLSSSALEFSTMAFSSCAIMIYIIDWRKPKDVALPFYFDTDVVVSPAMFKAIVESAPTVFMRTRLYSMSQSSVHQVIEGRYKPQHMDWLIVLVSIASTSIFGGIHLLAWNIDFPTPTERTLWRTTALLVTIIPSTCALCVLVESVLFGTTHRMSKWSSTSFSAFYFASRIYLIVESFRSLYFLEPDALTATWVTYVPHIR